MPHRAHHPGARPGLDIRHTLCVSIINHHHPHHVLLLDSSNRLCHIFQLSTLPCAPTTDGKRGGRRRFSSSRPDQPSHHRYLSTLGSSPRTTESLEVLRISLWSMWVVQERQRNHRSSRNPNARRLFS